MPWQRLNRFVATGSTCSLYTAKEGQFAILTLYEETHDRLRSRSIVNQAFIVARIPRADFLDMKAMGIRGEEVQPGALLPQLAGVPLELQEFDLLGGRGKRVGIRGTTTTLPAEGQD